MVDPAECERLRHRATEVLLHLVRDGRFHRAELFWSELARSSKATLTVVDAHGASAMVKTPNELFDILEDLRSEMADPGTGAWLSTTVWVDIEGDGGFDFNYDRRPYWSSPDPFVPTDRDRVDPNPADEAFLEDLVDHPRSADQLPPWYPTGRNDTATPTPGPGRLVGAALFPSSLASLATSADWVGIADAVRRHLTAVIAENPSAAGAALVQQTY